jgi:hypothetical protein
MNIKNLWLNSNFSVNPDILLQTITNNIVIAVSQHQKLLKNKQRELIQNLTKSHDRHIKIGELTRAGELRSEINNIREKNVVNILRNNRYYNILVNERASKSFCSLGKVRNSKESLDVICDQNSEPFLSDEARETYMSKSLGSIYNKKNSSVSINDFMGDLRNDARVPKLSEIDKNILDMPLTVDELNTAFRRSNKKSAGGGDLITYNLLKHFFYDINEIILDAFKKMIENGKLSGQFSNVRIRLIPKKGALENLTNWRPISLLSILYKLCSSIITARLLKVTDKICSHSQSGFSSKKRINSNLCSLLDSINVAKTSRKPAMIFCADFRKAFDSVSHEYVKKCLEYFNFGDTFINYIMTILSGKKGSIVTDEGGVGLSFDILSGTGQGDPPSPLIFNICLEPLLLRIALSNEITGITHIHDGIEHRAALVRAFADDTSIICKLSIDNINRILSIFNSFESLSGLSLNISKSEILPFNHNDDEVINYIKNHFEFKIVDELCTLGITISNKEDCEEINYLKISKKVKKIIAMWEKYSLTIYGRLNVAKTFLLSQISYSGAILRYNPIQLNEIETSIAKFIIGKEKIAKSRVFFRNFTRWLRFSETL